MIKLHGQWPMLYNKLYICPSIVLMFIQKAHLRDTSAPILTLIQGQGRTIKDCDQLMCKSI